MTRLTTIRITRKYMKNSRGRTTIRVMKVAIDDGNVISEEYL